MNEISRRDLAEDIWAGILLKIRHGEDPNREDLVAALRRQDPNIPFEVLLYVAALLGAEVDKPVYEPLQKPADVPFRMA